MNLNIDAGKGGKKQKIQVDAPGKKRKRGASLDVKQARERAGSSFSPSFSDLFSSTFL